MDLSNLDVWSSCNSQIIEIVLCFLKGRKCRPTRYPIAATLIYFDVIHSQKQCNSL